MVWSYITTTRMDQHFRFSRNWKFRWMRGTVKIGLEQTVGLAGHGNKNYFFPSCPLTIQQCDWQMMFVFVRSTGKIWNFTLVRCFLYFSSKWISRPTTLPENSCVTHQNLVSVCDICVIVLCGPPFWIAVETTAFGAVSCYFFLGESWNFEGCVISVY